MKINPYKIRLTIAAIVGIFSILAVCGVFYPLKIMDIQFTPLFQRLLVDFSITALALFVLIVVITLFFGRFYCSTICPFGIMQEFCALVTDKKKKQTHGSFGVKYLIAGLTFGTLIGGSALLIRYIDPYTIFGSAVSLSIFGIIFAMAVLALVFFKNRFFCTNICPVGTVLGLCSKLSFNKIYINESCVSCAFCAKNCPSGCIDYKAKNVDNETCVKCLKCLSVCPKKAINYGVKPVKFHPKRRDFIFGISALALLGAGYAAGLKFTKEFAKKVKDIILPAGAKNKDRMANKCLNCNLCIKNCPNEILTKADEKFSTVRIDFSKGKKHCKYECHKCSEVCPSGAIKKISLEEKQNTRIAMAVVQGQKCIKCSHCELECPKGAISMNKDGAAEVDPSKCIGCAKCSAVCPSGAIDIFPIKEQSMI